MRTRRKCWIWAGKRGMNVEGWVTIVKREIIYDAQGLGEQKIG